MAATDLRRAALAVFLLIALGWYAATRAHVPAASSVNGVYSNPCCGSFILRDGIIVIGTAHVPFDLENMKFGLTAYPSQQVQVRDSRLETRQDADPGPLSFNENGTVVTVCGDRLCNQTYAFRRNGRPADPLKGR